MSELEEQTAALLAYCRRCAAFSTAPDKSFDLSRSDAAMGAGLPRTAWTTGFFLIVRLRQAGKLIKVEDGGGLKVSRYRVAPEAAEDEERSVFARAIVTKGGATCR